MQEEKSIKDSICLIKSRREATVSGIRSILGFGEDYVSLDTECGRLEIEGEGMKIEELTRTEGTVYIKGQIKALYYSEEKPKLLSFRKNKK